MRRIQAFSIEQKCLTLLRNNVLNVYVIVSQYYIELEVASLPLRANIKKINI